MNKWNELYRLKREGKITEQVFKLADSIFLLRELVEEIYVASGRELSDDLDAQCRFRYVDEALETIFGYNTP